MRMRIVCAVAVLLGLGVLAAGGTASAAPADGYVPRHCYASELAAGFHGEQAGLGNRGFLLTLTNIGGVSCHLDGYPRLRLLDAAGWRLRTHERRGPTYFDADPGKHMIVLSPGETASTDISFGVAGDRSDSVLASYIQITPPGTRHHLVLPIPDGAALVYAGRLDVTALARHTPYSG